MITLLLVLAKYEKITILNRFLANKNVEITPLLPADEHFSPMPFPIFEKLCKFYRKIEIFLQNFSFRFIYAYSYFNFLSVIQLFSVDLLNLINIY
jgi:hypothetical protein